MATLNCPTCGTPFQPGDLICNRCGANLARVRGAGRDDAQRPPAPPQHYQQGPDQQGNWQQPQQQAPYQPYEPYPGQGQGQVGGQGPHGQGQPPQYGQPQQPPAYDPQQYQQQQQPPTYDPQYDPQPQQPAYDQYQQAPYEPPQHQQPVPPPYEPHQPQSAPPPYEPPPQQPPYQPYEPQGYDQQQYQPHQGYDPGPAQPYDPNPQQGYEPQHQPGYDPQHQQGYDPPGYDPQRQQGYDPNPQPYDPNPQPYGQGGYPPQGAFVPPSPPREATLLPNDPNAPRGIAESTAAMCPYCEAVLANPGAPQCDNCLRPLGPGPGQPMPPMQQGPPVLRLQFPGGHELQVPLGQHLVLGRDAGQSTVSSAFTQYDNVSRRHTTVWLDQSGTAWVRDERSTNGTFVNGERLPPGVEAPLRDGDELRLAADVTGQVRLG
jgi:hypothetical protein